MPRKVLERTKLWLLSKQIELPGYDKLLRTISSAYNQYNTTNHQKLLQHLSQPVSDLLDEVLRLNPDGESLLKTYKKPSQSERPQKIKESIQIFSSLKESFNTINPVVKALAFNDSAINYYAYRTIKTRNNLTRQSKERYLYLLCFLTHQYRVWQDTFVDIVLSSVNSAENMTDKIRQKELFRTNRQRKSATQLVIMARKSAQNKVDEAILVLRNPQTQADVKINEALAILETHSLFTPEQDTLIGNLDREVNRNDEEDFLLLFRGQYLSANNRIGGILRVLAFNRSSSDKVLMAAIDHFNSKVGKIKEPAKNITWLSDMEQNMLFDEKGMFDKNLYRMLLFREIANAFKEGTLVLMESYKYRHLEQYLLDKVYFKEHRELLLKECDLEYLSDFKKVIAVLKKELDQQYRVTNENFLQNKNPYLTIDKDGRRTIETPKIIQKTSGKEIDFYFEKAGYIAISEVEKSTAYLSQIEHLGGKYSKQRPSAETFFAALVGVGCNIKMDKMAAISKGINPSTLQLVSELYLNPDSLKAANDCLIQFKNKLALPELHRKDAQELHTASDGQKFLSNAESMNADYSYKYPGFQKAVAVKTAMDERFSIIHSMVISASEREAAYMIDIHVNNPAVKSTIHSTDSHGYTEIGFGAMNMLGICFAPRLKDLASQQIYSFSKRREYKALDYPILPDKSIDESLIEENWEDILRVMVTLKSGKTTAHRIFKRLSSYAKQNPLHKALKEYGKIVKSGFILRYYDELEFRQSIEKQLSNIELVNKFSKAVFFGNNQEFMVGLKDEQEKVVLARRLIQNAIIIWNYLFLSEMIHQMKTQKEVQDLIEALQGGTIIHWAHINLQGEYDFTALLKNKKLRFDLERILSLKLDKAA